MFRLVQDCTCHILLCKRFYLMYEYRCFGIVFPPKAYAYKAFHIKHLIRNGEQDSSTLTILHLTTIPKTIKQSYIIVTAASEILRCMLTIGNVSNSLQHGPKTSKLNKEYIPMPILNQITTLTIRSKTYKS